MKQSVHSLKLFGLYMNLLGAALIVVPNLLLSLFGIAPTSEVWVRVAGVLVFNLGIYYRFALKNPDKAFIQASIYARMFVLAAFIAFILFGFATPVFLLFGAVDAAGALWTWIALRGEEREESGLSGQGNGGQKWT
ncbi:hypothetical protein [Chlorobium ferrooxidans]|uniref:Uncharacterized protein n=1 Tax=Chlorobium ferrooxidans DSM 13031 TaxID=377431 RepID=Q0YSY9_9CHLB|nr:hypothetical protein [Chlorobium ferrooxidans]EAT59475.1 hypothetical protein CferDRAFT_1402 [Chlorobium ferrooxidans DSM 13031]